MTRNYAGNAELVVGSFDLNFPGKSTRDEANGFDAGPCSWLESTHCPGTVSWIARPLTLCGREEHIPFKVGPLIVPIGRWCE